MFLQHFSPDAARQLTALGSDYRIITRDFICRSPHLQKHLTKNAPARLARGEVTLKDLKSGTQGNPRA